MNGETIHALLPWYVNGTLSDEEAAEFERHLTACGGCTEELALLERLRAEAERHGEALFGEHPSAERLVAFAAPEGSEDPLPADEATAIGRHLALCAACAEEARWVQGEAVAGGTPSRAESRRRPARSAWPWAAAAAVLLLAAVGLIALRDGRGAPGAGVGSIALLEPTQRSGGEVAEVAVPATAPFVHFLLPVDLLPQELPATLVVVGEHGREVHRQQFTAEELFEGLHLSFWCDRRRCTDGAYTIRLTPAGAERAPIEYPVRLTTGR